MKTYLVTATAIYRSLQKQQFHCAGGDKWKTINSGNSRSKQKQECFIDKDMKHTHCILPKMMFIYSVDQRGFLKETNS